MFLNTCVQECAKLSQLALLKCPSYTYGTSQSPGCGNGAIAVAVKFSCSWISPRFPRRAPVPHTVPWVQQPAFCPCQLQLWPCCIRAARSQLGRWGITRGCGCSRRWQCHCAGLGCGSAALRCSRKGRVGLAGSAFPPVHTCRSLALPFWQEQSSSPQATSPWEICFDIGPEHFSSD